MTLGRTRAAGGRYTSPESSSSPASIHSKYRAGRISVRIVLVTTHLRSVLSRTLVSSCDTFFRTSAHGRACTWRQSPVVRGGAVALIGTGLQWEWGKLWALLHDSTAARVGALFQLLVQDTTAQDFGLPSSAIRLRM